MPNEPAPEASLFERSEGDAGHDAEIISAALQGSKKVGVRGVVCSCDCTIAEDNLTTRSAGGTP